MGCPWSRRTQKPQQAIPPRAPKSAITKALNHSPEQRRDYHAEHSLSVMETLKDWGEAQINGDDLSSLIATCELNGVNAYDYLIAIQRYRQEVSRQPENWLPGTYREAIDKRENQAA